MNCYPNDPSVPPACLPVCVCASTCSEELATVLRDLNVPVKPQDFEELLEELDSDGSGDIDFEEFYNCE